MFGISKELDAAEVASKPITIIGDIPRVDLLTVANKVKYEQAIVTARCVRVDGVRIVYAGFDALLKSKAAGKLQDQIDIEHRFSRRAHRHFFVKARSAAFII